MEKESIEKQAEIYSQAATIVKQVIDQHVNSLKALENIQNAMGSIENAFRAGNIGETTKIAKQLPPQYEIIANSAFREAELLNELTKKIIEAAESLNMDQLDQFQDRTADDSLRGYV